MATPQPSKRETALVDVLARWATQPVLRERLAARLEKKPLDTIADLMGLETSVLREIGKRAADQAAARLLALFRAIATAEERSKVDYRLTAGSVRKLFVPVVASLTGTIGPLRVGAAGTVSAATGNEEICQLRTAEVEQRYQDLQEADGRWEACATDHTGSLEDVEQVCLAELMNLWAAGEAYLHALYLKDLACSGIEG